MSEPRSNFERLGDGAYSYADKLAGKAADHPRRMIAKIVGVLIVLTLIGGFLSWLSPWANEAKRVTGPANVTEQYRTIIGDWQSLVTTADNACNAITAAHDNGSPTLVEDPALAYKATFFRVRTDYNTRWHDIFEAGLVGPRGYPHTAPDFPETHQPHGDWCKVAEGVVAIHD